MTLVPVIHAGGTAYIRADTAAYLGIRAHDTLDATLWLLALTDQYQRRKAER